jgi:hypothetical protein
MNTIAGCNCTGAGLGNTGYPNVKPFGVTAGIYMVPVIASDGTRNGLDLTSTTLGADFLAMVNNPDSSKRAFPYLDLKNVTPAEEDATFATDDRGIRSWLRNGIQSISYSQWDVSEQYFAKVNTACVDFGIYEVDNCGNLKGQKEGDKFYPRPMNSQSFNVKYMPATNEAKAQVMFNVDYDVNTSNGAQWMLPASDFGDLSLLSLKGMIDVELSLVDIVSLTEFVIDAEFGYGFANNAHVFTGATAADFTVLNLTTNAPITPTVVENAQVKGRYTLTIPAVTSGDVLLVDVYRAATGNLINGFEGVELEFDYVP